MSAYITTEQLLQFTAWFWGLVELVLALYVLLLNAQHIASRHVSALVLMLGINTFALGMLATAITMAQACLPMPLLSSSDTDFIKSRGKQNVRS